MKHLVSAAIAIIFAAVTLTAGAQVQAPSGAPGVDAPKTEKRMKKAKKAKRAKAKKGVTSDPAMPK